jgi:hypothetical protein
MAISVVQRASGQDNATGTVSATLGSPITAGNNVIVITGVNNTLSNLGTPSDGLNIYKKVAPIYQSSMNVGFNAWIAYQSPAITPTVSCSDNFNLASIFIYEVSGLTFYNAFDQYATAQVTGTSSASPSITPFYPNELVLGIFGTEDTSSASWTEGGSFVNIQNQPLVDWNSAVEELVVSSTSSINATATYADSSQIVQCAIIAFSNTPINRRVLTNPQPLTSIISNDNIRPHPFSPGLAR